MEKGRDNWDTDTGESKANPDAKLVGRKGKENDSDETTLDGYKTGSEGSDGRGRKMLITGNFVI